MTTTYLADLLRDIAACPNQPAKRALLEIAAQVGRQESFLDNIVADAQGEATARAKAVASKPWRVVP